MRRVNIPEILDSDECPPQEVGVSLRDLSRINRTFGGVATSLAMVDNVAKSTGQKKFSLLEVAAGFGEVPRLVAREVAKTEISIDVTLLDLKLSHLQRGNRAVVANALALPFPNNSFDLVSCSLFAHHLEPDELAEFAREAMRVSRVALLINDLVRHPVHLALVYAGWPLMRSYVSRVDGVASVRRAYLPKEMREILARAFARPPKIDISRHFLFRMGVILWKST